MNRPLIGITAGEVINKDRPMSPIVYGQTQTYVNAVINSGGLPVILPLTASEEVLSDIGDKLDGLLLAGGNDVNPALYNEVPYTTTETVSELRDGTEYHLLSKALARNIPILAICRGMQLLNVYYGGTLHQHIPHDTDSKIEHEVVDPTKDPLHNAHDYKVEVGTKLHNILGEVNLTVNSYHHQAVKQLGEGLKVSAYSPEDNVIEGIETTDDKYIIGVQPHPESITDAVPTWKRLFDSFIEESSGTKSPSSHQNSSDSLLA